MTPEVGLNLRDILLFLFFIAVRDGLPWLMHKAFPLWHTDKKKKQIEEANIRRLELELHAKIAESELALKRDIAEREAVMEARNIRAIEAIEKNVLRLTELIGGNTMQLNAIAQTMSSTQREMRTFFLKERHAVSKQIVAKIPKARKTDKK